MGSGQEMGRTYALDALGALAAGIATALAFLAGVSGLRSALGLGGLTLACLAGFLALNRRRVGRDLWLHAVMLLLFAGVLGAAWAQHDRLQGRLLRRQWPGYDAVVVRESVCGRTVVLARGRQRSLFYNGAFIASSDDPAGAAEFAHLALLRHPQPRRVLLLGGAGAGLLAPLLRHPGVEVDVLEPDRALLALVQAAWTPLPPGAEECVRFEARDPRRFLAEPGAAYDVIVLAAGDPGTVQGSRLYTVESFEQMRARLAPGGFVAVAVSGDDAFLGAALAAYLRSVHATLATAFPRVEAIPGFTTLFLAGVDAADPLPAAEQLAARAAERGIVDPAAGRNILEQRLDPARLAWFMAQLRAEPAAPRNRDLRPILPWHVVRVWRQAFTQRQVKVDLGRARRHTALALVGVVALLQLGCMATRRRRPLLLLFLLLNGLNGMGLNVFLLFSAQAAFGFLYFLLGLILAGFMCGLSLGAWLHLQWQRRPWVRLAPIPLGQGGVLASYAAAVAAPLALRFLPGSAPFAAGGALLYLLLAVGGGACVGFLFIEGCRAARRADLSHGATGDLGLYVTDLLGGCAGALVVAPLLLPLLGLAEGALLLGVLSLGVGALAWLRLR
jgi:spermidine synthase